MGKLRAQRKVREAGLVTKPDVDVAAGSWVGGSGRSGSGRRTPWSGTGATVVVATHLYQLSIYVFITGFFSLFVTSGNQKLVLRLFRD